jgi:hypothetical protein
LKCKNPKQRYIIATPDQKHVGFTEIIFCLPMVRKDQSKAIIRSYPDLTNTDNPHSRDISPIDIHSDAALKRRKFIYATGAQMFKAFQKINLQYLILPVT